MKKDKVLFTASILGAFVSLLINIFAVPSMQSIGSAIVLVSAEIVVTLVYMVYTLWNKLAKFSIQAISKNIFYSLPSVLICYLCRYYIINSFFSVGLAICLSTLFWLGMNIVFKTWIGNICYRRHM